MPVVLDASALAYSLAGMVQRSRGESACLSWALMFVFTLMSILGDAAHGLDVAGPARTIVALVVAESAPLSVFLTARTLGALVAARPELVVEQNRQVEQINGRVNLPQGDDEGTLARMIELAAHGQRHLDIANEVGWSRQRVTHVLRAAA